VNVSDEPLASIHRADNFIATRPIFVEGNLLFALICVYPYVSSVSTSEIYLWPHNITQCSVTVGLLFMCSFIQVYYYCLLVSKLGVIIALIFCVPSHADAYAMRLKDVYCVLEEHISFSRLHGLKCWKTNLQFPVH
jgi:hypothetical protein